MLTWHGKGVFTCFALRFTYRPGGLARQGIEVEACAGGEVGGQTGKERGVGKGEWELRQTRARCNFQRGRKGQEKLKVTADFLSFLCERGAGVDEEVRHLALGTWSDIAGPSDTAARADGQRGGGGFVAATLRER